MTNLIKCPHCKSQSKAEGFQSVALPEVWCEYCGGERLRYISSDGFPYCDNPKCSHMMHWGKKPEGAKIANPAISETA